jgi:hypothetical protein
MADIKNSGAEVKRNYEAFVKVLPTVIATHRGKFALLHDAKIVEYFDTAADAYRAGQQLFPDRTFSIQEVTDTPVDLGFFSHALPQRVI